MSSIPVLCAGVIVVLHGVPAILLSPLTPTLSFRIFCDLYLVHRSFFA